MKKLLLLLLLLPFTALAKFYKGEIVLNDSTVKPGYIEIPTSHNQRKIRFKANPEADVEKFSAEDVTRFYVENAGEQETETLFYITCRLADNKMIGNGFKVEKSKSWVRIQYSGTLNIVTANYYQNGTSGFIYYVHFPEEGTAVYLGAFYGGMSITNQEFVELKRQIARVFEEKCPELAENLTKEDCKRLNSIIDLYNKHCKN
jgi:hypothetical protein